MSAAGRVPFLTAGQALRDLIAHANAADLNGVQWRVLSAVIVETLSFSKIEDEVTLPRLAAHIYGREEVSASSWRRIRRTLRELDSRGLLTVTAPKGRPAGDQQWTYHVRIKRDPMQGPLSNEVATSQVRAIPAQKRDPDQGLLFPEKGPQVGSTSDAKRDPKRHKKGTPRGVHTTKEVPVEEHEANASAAAPRNGEVKPATAQTLIAEWIDHCRAQGAPPPSRRVGQVAKQIKDLLDEGYDYKIVRRGLQAWDDRLLNPSLIPDVVHEVMRPPADRRRPIRPVDPTHNPHLPENQ